ncbi:hypothetical protein [Leptolyngbya sp. 7M]|uniref:hypothetical protein n=1 Tax=Leptolyngbya sp. 7M TaxID=2812896 RepID=UPI001B8B5235|nr:hypothetical protein [Leptolyngbya sp. 7M]QYO63583.1 hypothetical protein JVX88_27450 [Leptolyngbya sp. 7M]
MSTVLAIETSCDETAVAIVQERQILSNVVSSQIQVHQPYGGVVPEVASRQHVEMVNWAVEQALQQADLDWSGIDGVAATCAPGLVGALLVGVTAAKTCGRPARSARSSASGLPEFALTATLGHRC